MKRRRRRTTTTTNAFWPMMGAWALLGEAFAFAAFGPRRVGGVVAYYALCE